MQILFALFFMLCIMTEAFAGKSELVQVYNFSGAVRRVQKIGHFDDFYRALKIFNEVYISAIEHYYYDEYGTADLDFCHFFSLILAVIENESSFNPQAIAKVRGKPTGVGLMQINYTYWKERLPQLRMEWLFDPYFNVRFGSRVLILELARTKSLRKALTLYVGASSPQTPIAKSYFRKVHRSYRKWRSLICSPDQKVHVQQAELQLEEFASETTFLRD